MKFYQELFTGIDTDLLKARISNAQSIIITAHKSPDGDAVGSTLGLWNTLRKMGKNAKVILPDSFPAFFDWMNGADQCLFYDKNRSDCDSLFQHADIIFCLDYNDFTRVGEMQYALTSASGFKVMIDHHPDPTNDVDVLISSIKECATCQMVYQFLFHLNLTNHITPEAASCLYCGIMTDTGSFRHAGTTAKTHQIVSDLIALGVDNAGVHAKVFDNDSESRLRLLGYALSEKMIVLRDLKTSYFVLTAKELEQFNYQPGDTEGLVNYGLAVKGVEMSAIFIERKGIIKVSFRSKGTLPVNIFSKSYFNGGGHRNAAGGSAECNLSEAESLFLNKLPEFIKQYAN